MKGLAVALVLVLSLGAILPMAGTAAGQATSEIGIAHTPPTVVLPGLQINLTAVLTNATGASVTWNNGSMAADSLAPMTNTSERSGTGWVYDAWLPAQADGIQVSYSINASNGAASRTASYFLVVSAPTSQGLTATDQVDWILTIAAVASMSISTIAVLYWYMGRRLRREV